MDDRISMTKSQRQLATLWYAMALPAFVVLMINQVNGGFDSRETELWGWMLPTVLPTLLLITGSVVVDAVQQQTKRTRLVPRFARNVTIGLSVFYLLAVNYVIIHSCVAGRSLVAMQKSSVFLGPIQGLVGVALAVFFGTSSDAKDTKGKA
jgi:hypothetical protein